eukprot:1473943-Rhodomonas_salina.3
MLAKISSGSEYWRGEIKCKSSKAGTNAGKKGLMWHLDAVQAIEEDESALRGASLSLCQYRTSHRQAVGRCMAYVVDIA